MSDGKAPIWAAPDSRATVSSDNPMWIIGSELCLQSKKMYKKSVMHGSSVNSNKTERITTILNPCDRIRPI